MAVIDYQDRPWDPNDPSTWTDPSGVPVNAPASSAAGTDVQTPLPGDGGTGEASTTTFPAGPTGVPPEGRKKVAPVPVTPHEEGPPPPPPPPIPGPLPGPAPSPITIDPGTSAYNAQLRQFMLSQLGQLSTPTTADSEEIAPAIAAYNTQSQRDQQSERDAVAERFYAQGANGGQGLNSGGFNSAITQGAEAAGLNRQNFSGNMVWNAAQSKRQQLQALLQTATGAGETDAAQQIQAQIANIDASLRSQGLSQQNAQFGDQLGLSYAQLTAQMNRDELLAALGG